jgi:hypothetical protein
LILCEENKRSFDPSRIMFDHVTAGCSVFSGFSEPRGPNGDRGPLTRR